ncbi:MAG: glycoside hydrolase family 15 protein [Actinomycetota bacterium]|nr:glycoside hydrolase family 15 protein [Actinomycetota bacterium]
MAEDPARGPDRAGAYPPIADYAFLSDCHSTALVSRDGSVDWACLRRFSAGSVFGRLLDWERGGHFAISAVDVRERGRRYLDGTLVLETTVVTGGGRARLVDAFAMRRGGRQRPHHQLVRVVEGVEGHVEVDVEIRPRFDYGDMRPWLRAACEPGAFTFVGGDDALVLRTDADLELDRGRAGLSARAGVGAGDRLRFTVVSQPPHLLDARVGSPVEVDGRLDETVAWWRGWSERTSAQGPYAEHVRRSAVVLKGLTCAPTGAIVAAPTTSLPERIGGGLNWDYRYAWVRDAALSLHALALAGHPEVARGLREFFMRSAAGHAEDLQILYGAYGERRLGELELDLDGYRGSRPVRIGNRAANQLQLDVYGHLLDATYHWHATQERLDPDEWSFLAELVDAAAATWERPDSGIWELRGDPQHFVHSKVMAWVALDRGVKFVEETGTDDPRERRWRHVRDDVRAAVETRGVHPVDGYFLRVFDSEEVDASLLRLPIVGFVDARDERMVRTVEVIKERLRVPPAGFLRRYRADDADRDTDSSPNAFLLCGFWLVEVLAMQGSVKEATGLFEQLLDVGNDLGLFAEEYDGEAGRLCGNFPQAFTHLGLVRAADQLGRSRGD